jgi:hypothetical protein
LGTACPNQSYLFHFGEFLAPVLWYHHVFPSISSKFMAIRLSHVRQAGLPINVEQVSFPNSLGDPVVRANV